VVAATPDGTGAQRTAFVFCGGAGLGAVQVGQLRALVERGIRPDIVTGTSSGALNALVYASDPGMEAVDRLERLWLSVRRRDLFFIRPWTIGHGLFGSSSYLAANARLRRLLASSLPIASLEDTKVAIAIVVADTVTRRPVVLRSGPAVDILLASSAVPGLFPAVEIDGREYVDGGMVADPAVGPAVEMGATDAYVLPVGWPLAEPHAGNAMMRVADAVDWLCWRIAEFEVERWSARCRIELVPSPSTRQIAPFDLRSTRGLIDQAYALTAAWLDDPDHQLRPVPAATDASGRLVPLISNVTRRGRRLMMRLRRD
jgi:NTE family protein